MSRALLTLCIAVLLVSTGFPSSGAAADEADRLAPPIPAPAPWQKSAGFNLAELAPYRHELGDERLQHIVSLAQGLFATPSFAAFRELVAGAAETKRREEQYAQEFDEQDTLISYTLPNDPLLLLGMGKSSSGKVTALPRLLSGASYKKPAASNATDGTPFENFLLRNPEQVCTAGLSYSLNPEGSGFAGIEFMPPPLPMDDPLTHMLLFIEHNPSPILLTEEPAALNLASAAEALAASAATTSTTDANDPATPAEDIAYNAPYGSIWKKAHKGEVSLRELSALFTDKKASPYAPGHVQKLAGFFNTLAESARTLKRDCVSKGNLWTEGVVKNGSELNLMGCFTPSGRRIGLGASFVGDAFPWSGLFTMHAADASGTTAVHATLDAAEALLRVSTFAGETLVKNGPEMIYAAAGPAIALNFNTPDALRSKAGEYEVFEWHNDGHLKMIGRRNAGSPVDERSYYASGTLAGHVTFNHARLVSYREWFDNQRPAEDTLFDSDGSMHGMRRWWHRNGRPAGEIAYKNGQPDGAMLLWYDGGKTGVRATYKNGALDGDVHWAYEDGGNLYDGHFTDDKADGVVRLTLASGIVVSERLFQRGEPVGNWVAFDAQGRPAQEFSFKNGQKDGKSLLKYPTGQTAVELVWKAGQLEGALRSFYQNGQVAAICDYEHDRLVAFQRFHETGEQAMDGHVVDQGTGSGQFTTYRLNASPVISCKLTHWEPTACRVFDQQSRELTLPGYRALTAHVEAVNGLDAEGLNTGKLLQWRPELCGGYELKYNFDPLIDYGQDLVTVTISAKESCQREGLAEALYCSVSLLGGHVKADPCSMAGGDDGEMQEGAAMDDETPEAVSVPALNTAEQSAEPEKTAVEAVDPWAPDNHGYDSVPEQQAAAVSSDEAVVPDDNDTAQTDGAAVDDEVRTHH